MLRNRDGSPQKISWWNSLYLCPADKDVVEEQRKFVRKIIGEWGFDGLKLDGQYMNAVPACYNPKHHHKSPQDSINAMGEVYKQIFETTRALKPESVTQSCPCGTTPNIAWLPYLDQAVTADPNDSDYRFNLAVALYKNGDNTGALRQLKDELQQRPNDTEAKALLEMINRGVPPPPAPPTNNVAAAYTLLTSNQARVPMERRMRCRSWRTGRGLYCRTRSSRPGPDRRGRRC